MALIACLLNKICIMFMLYKNPKLLKKSSARFVLLSMTSFKRKSSTSV